MLGKYKIKVRRRKVEYSLEISRNITILTGDSAIGKTDLIRAIRQYDELGSNSGVHLECNKKCVVLEGKYWERDLQDIDNSIVFIDESSKFVSSVEFAEAIKNSNNYYVIITRQKLSNLPYSINEIYTLRCDKIDKDRIYNSQTRIYSGITNVSNKHIDKIITEDSESGYLFFNEASNIYKFSCESAGGKSNIINLITEQNKDITLLIVDGAAFGPKMRDVIQLINSYRNYILYAPESFEWMLLKSKIIKYNNLDDMLINTFDYADSTKFFSWEKYYEHLIKILAQSNELIKQYKKGTLNRYFITVANIKKIVESTPIYAFFKSNEF